MRGRSAVRFAALTAIAALTLGSGGECMSPMHFRAKGSGGGGATGGGGSGGATACVPGAVMDCYSGPEGTQGQGICKPGTQACNADGSGFGECVGEVLPGVEDCATPLDEDCDGLAPTCEGLCLWSKGFGDAKSQSAQIVTLDPFGAVVVAGSFYGSIDFGGGALTSAQEKATFLAKLDAEKGGYLWSKGFGGGIQSFGSLAVGVAGDVTATGTFSGPVDFGGGPLDGGVSSTFVVQFGPDGAYHWSKKFSGGIQAPQGGALDFGGDAVVVGSFLGTTDFGAGPVSAKPGAADVFLVKLSGTDGSHLWSKTFGDVEDQSGTRVVVDPADGDLVVAGKFLGAVDFGSGALTNDQPGSDLFVAKLATLDAAPIWVKQIRGDQSHSVADMTSDDAGHVIVTGTFLGSSDLGGASMVTSAGGADIFVTKLAAPDGAFVWGKTFGQEGDQSVAGVVADGKGNIELTGTLSDDTDFGGGPLAAAGLDVYVVKLEGAAGKHVWSKRFGDAAFQSGLGVAADSAGNAFLTGFFNGTINFGCGKLTSAGDTDVFVAKLSP